jgi:hypothetical protein
MIQMYGVEIPNQLNELTVQQFDELNKIENNQELDTIEKWIEKFIYLGVPEKAFDNMELEEFANYIKVFNKSDIPQGPKVTELVIDKYTYQANETIGVKDLGMLERIYRSQADDFCAQTLAILFKRTDLTRTEHYAPAHLKFKVNLMRKQSAEIAFPYIMEILSKITKIAEKKVDEFTEELDSSNGEPMAGTELN